MHRSPGKHLLTFVLTLLLAGAFPAACARPAGGMHEVKIDTVMPEEDKSSRYTGLTDADFRLVAD